MHVLMAIAEMGSGGAETVVADLSSELLHSGNPVTIASAGGWRADELEHQGARIVELPLRERRPDRMAVATATLRRHVRKYPVTLVHAHNARATMVAHLASRWPGRRPPLLATMHGQADPDHRSSVRILLRCADLVAPVSHDLAERLRYAGLPAARLAVVENAVRVPTSHSKGEARARLGLSPNAPVVLCAARLAPLKRHDLLLQAWRQMPAESVLLLAGDGSRRNEIEGAVQQFGLQNSVRLLGTRQDMDWLLAAADVAVLPSDREGLPMAVLEAMAAGVPMVASAVGAIPDLGPGAVELVAPGSVASLIEGLDRALHDRARRKELAEAGRRLAGKQFSAERMHREYYELYERLLARSAGLRA